MNVVVPGSIAYYLIEDGKITEEQLKEALESQKESKNLIGVELVARGFCTELDIAKAMEKKTGYKFVSIEEVGINFAIANIISPDLMAKRGILPLYQDEKRLFVVMRNPNDVVTRDNLSVRTGGMEIVPLIATDTELTAAINTIANNANNIDTYDEEEAQEEELSALDELAADEKPAVQLVNQVITNAVKSGASDIHFEPMEKTMRVRLRIDGVLHEVLQQPIKLHNSVASRVKVIGGMDIAERRIPQDGRTTVKVDDRTFDIRIAVLPSVYGEKIVMRLLERGAKSVQLKDIKFSKAQADRFMKTIFMPYGFLLVTGPTGSGKSTTLYATLSEVSDIKKHTITLEDPVERRMPGLCQVQMNTRAGMTFAAALRSVLRADPDIVMVGEIRDGETAKIAVESALTGHMVFSTLHTNDAPSAITRLDEMGVEPFLTASSLVGVLAQRLIRVLCPRCKEAVEITYRDLRQSIEDFPIPEGKTLDDTTTIYEPKGCIACSNTGYKGRQGVFEFLQVTNEMKQLILKRSGVQDIKELAISQGMHTLHQEGIDKILDGTSSVEEVLRVLV
ncbi:MAG: Flp pilus assembly complex ATPase component TadA [Clostridia bacterium]|nr:Flp pilus assembly complex ATPase component TadA [Clostridia bacterium]